MLRMDVNHWQESRAKRYASGRAETEHPVFKTSTASSSVPFIPDSCLKYTLPYDGPQTSQTQPYGWRLPQMLRDLEQVTASVSQGMVTSIRDPKPF